jgi:Sulfatase
VACSGKESAPRSGTRLDVCLRLGLDDMVRVLWFKAWGQGSNWSPTGRQALFYLSLANLCFYNAWTRILRPEDLSFQFQPFTYKPLAAVLICVWALAILLWALHLAIVKFHASTVARLVFPSFVVVPFLVSPLLGGHIKIKIFLGLALVLTALLRTGWAIRFARGAVMWALPLLPIQCMFAIKVALDHPAPQIISRKSDPLARIGTSPPRIVWVIFDELDQTLAFSNRPDTVNMPEFDRLRHESFYATDTESPASWTNRSIPALIMGRFVADAHPKEDGDLNLMFTDSQTRHSWKEQSSVFQDARRLGRKTGLVGWYLPYCSVLSESLDYCYAAPDAGASPSIRKVDYDSSLPFSKELVNEVREEEAGFLPEVRHTLEADEYSFVRYQHEEAYAAIRTRALKLVSDPSYGLVLIHWPIPHPFGIYRRSRTKGSMDHKADYLDNLELADQTLGLIRHTMESAGIWDESILLVTADHGYRRFLWSTLPDWEAEDAHASATITVNRVPFLLKMPREAAGVVYSRHFNSILTRDLFTAMLTGKIRGAEEVGNWIGLRTDPSSSDRSRRTIWP